MSGKKEKQSNPQGQSQGPPKQKQQQQQQQNKGNDNKGNQKNKQQLSKQQGNQKKGGVAQGHEDDVKRDQKLQAVILADSFNQTFRPITLEKPKVLLPVVNIPMLDYTIEFLAQNGVEEIIVYCVWYGNLIEEYINSSKWSSIISIKCVCQPTCGSAGDALRELDSLNIVRSDPFILISGDVVSNMNLKKAIDYHKLKRKQDPNNIMTCVLKKIQQFAPSKSLLDDLVIGLHPNSSQILFFEDSIGKDEVSFSLELLTENNTSEILFHNDLLDCNIDICSQELLLQFSDNFDYQDIRQDFIRNEAANFSLGKHLYAYILQNEYAARVKDPHTYHAISRDIVTRWVYPFVPEIQLIPDSSVYTQSKRYVYKSQGVKISRTAGVGEEVVLGKGTVVGNNSQITRTIFGKDNKIGNDTRIVNSHIWNGVIIEDNVSIDSAILCDNVIIRKGAVIPRGCILSFGVEIGENVHLAEFSRITKSNEAKASQPIENVQGNAWNPENVSDPFNKKSSYGNDIDTEQAYRMFSIGCHEDELWRRELWSTLPAPLDDDEEDDEYDEDIFNDLKPSRDITSHGNEDGAESNGLNGNDANDEDEESDEENATRDVNFARNITELVVTAMKETHPVDSILMEIKGFKFAQNKSYGDCLQGIIEGLFTVIIEQTNMPQTILQLLKKYTKKDAFFYTLIKNMTHNVHNEVEIITFIEDFALKFELISPLFRFILQVFHDPEVDHSEDDAEEEGLLSASGILQWAEKRQKLSALHPKSKFVHDPKVEEFLEWLEDEEEDDDEEEEDGEKDTEEEDDDEESDN